MNKISTLKNNFKKNFDGLNYMKLLGNKKFNKDVTSWFKILQETKKYVEQIQRNATKKCLQPEHFNDSKEFLMRFVEFAKLMPNDSLIRQNYSKGLMRLGLLNIEEAKAKNADIQQKYNEAIYYFNLAVQIDFG